MLERRYLSRPASRGSYHVNTCKQAKLVARAGVGPPNSLATCMARNGMSPARLKYIMGHADIATTYNIYTHLGFEDVREEVLRIEREGL